MTLRVRRIAPAVVALVALLLNAPALGAPLEQGHWEYLGEDGAIWVPADPPTVTYLPPDGLGDYHNATEAADALAALAASRPDLLTLQTMGHSRQDRPIFLATLTGPGDASGRTHILFDGAHHGDEVIGSEILVRFLQRAVAEHDTNATMRDALAQVVVHVVPMVNPDGIELVPNCNYYADCRKNAHGVDLNRNYPSHWGEPGASGDPNHATYRGPSPASEPETQVITGLLDDNDYALYASLHSGADMILWPYGWTTSPPPEQAVYQQLGDELSAITGAPHGQVSRILYGVSGDSMDQAYVTAKGWRAIAISPETYRGSGTAYDWWHLFNPPENDASITPVVARWDKFLWHMVTQAPLYAPVKLVAPDSLSLGPDAEDANFVVTGPLRRPFMDASVSFVAGDDEAVSVLSANPYDLPDGADAASGTFTLLPMRGGSFTGRFLVDAGPAGTVQRDVALNLVQVGVALTLERASMGSPETNAALLTIDAGPFAHVEGVATLRAQPQDVVLASVPFTATPGAPADMRLPFDALSLEAGDHTLVATATFNATDDEDNTRSGQIRATTPLLVLRPQMTLDKRFLPDAAPGEPVLITSYYRNTGSMTSTDFIVRETIPPGYAFWTRDGPVPIPLYPLGRPEPTAIEPQPDGSVDLVFDFGSVAPGQLKFVQYRMLALLPGEHALPSAWTYTGAFETVTVAYEEASAPTHVVREP